MIREMNKKKKQFPGSCENVALTYDITTRVRNIHLILYCLMNAK